MHLIGPVPVALICWSAALGIKRVWPMNDLHCLMPEFHWLTPRAAVLLAAIKRRLANELPALFNACTSLAQFLTRWMISNITRDFWPMSCLHYLMLEFYWPDSKSVGWLKMNFTPTNRISDQKKIITSIPSDLSILVFIMSWKLNCFYVLLHLYFLLFTLWWRYYVYVNSVFYCKLVSDDIMHTVVKNKRCFINWTNLIW